jgi:eukaryotic-like serine/threonine-protein kinase
MSYLPVTGERIRDYEILGRIGAGGMGVVFNARDLKLDRIVALKFLSARLTYTADEKRGLLQEARLISALDHPNICTIYAVEERTLEDYGSQIFIVMGYYDGGSLADHIGAGPMLLPDILDLLTGIASGLAAAHARRVVHRDIKPSNILLTRESLVKIVDFGLAKIVSSSSQTQSADTSGTLAYMAPEQINGEVVDQRADIWSVGVLAAEMLSGVHPFKRDNLAATAFAICHDAPRVADDAPLALQGIIYKCLSKDPTFRYQSCDEMLDDLRPLRTESAHLPAVPGVASGANSAGQGSGSHGSRSRTAGSANAVGWLTERRLASTRRKVLESSILAASGSRGQRRSWAWWWVPLAVVVIAVVVMAVPSLRERTAGVLLSPSEKHIAVLPFDNLDAGKNGGGDVASDAVAGGLMDSMTGALSNLDSGDNADGQKALWVVPSSVVRSQHVDDPSSALDKLRATLVVKGSIAHSGKAVTLVANLINTKTMAQIGSATASNADGDLAAAQEQVVVQLGRMLNVSVAHGDAAHQANSSAPAAYDLYLEALNYMQRFDKPGNLDLAIARLQTAIGEDPQFALAYATQGEAYRLKYEAGSDDKWLKLALESCQQAIKLNPALPGAYVTLGDIHAVTGHAELAADEFQRALSLDSRNPAAISGLGWSYEHSGRLADAEAEYKKALVLRPGDWYSNDRLALFYDRQGRYNDAIAQVKQVIELTPDNRNAYYDLGAFYLEAGDPKNYKAAEEALKKSLAISPNYPAYGNLGLLYLEEKRYKEAAEMAEKALAINDQDLLPWSYSELAYRWLHDDKKADAALARMQSMAEAEVKQNPQGAEAQSWLGLAYAKRGLRGKALPHIEAALALAPTNQQVLVNTIEAYVIIGDDATALGLMQQAKQGGVALPDLKLEPRMQPLLLKTKS